MSEETEITENATPTSDADDKRFEVKWRKKDEPGPAASATQEQQAAPAAPESVEALQRELDEERRRTAQLQERWQRAAADLSNLRRRTEQERGEVEKFASMLLIQELLPVLDNFERALATIPGNLAMLTWIQGVMLIERQFQAILERQGLTVIEAVGQPFNPHLHEAIGERETDEAAPGTVLQEYQKGYSMHGRVIRPSLVELAKAPAGGDRAVAQNEDQAPGPDGEQIAADAAAATQAVEPADRTEGEEIAEEAETKNVGP